MKNAENTTYFNSFHFLLYMSFNILRVQSSQRLFLKSPPNPLSEA
jgi:hypothetical protein